LERAIKNYFVFIKFVKEAQVYWDILYSNYDIALSFLTQGVYFCWLYIANLNKCMICSAF